MKIKLAQLLKSNNLLILILFIAFFIRVLGTIPGHNPFHPDEPMSYGSALEMIRHGDLNPRRFDYPAGVPLVHLFFYNSFILPAVFLKVFLSHPEGLILNFISPKFINDFSSEIFGINDINALFWSRIITAILGSLSVYLVYVIGKRLFNVAAGLGAAFFLAFNYRHVLSSHLALSDIPNSFFALLAFYASTLLLEKNTKSRYLFAGLTIGLSLSMKYQIFALFPFLFVQILWVLKKRKFSELFNKNFLLALFIIPLVFVVLNPYLLLNLKTALPVIRYVGGRYGAGANRFNFYPLYYLFHFGIGNIAFIVIILGFITALYKSFVKSLFIFAYVGSFLYIFLYYMLGGSYVRNFTTVMPFLSLFFGFFVFFVVTKLKIKRNFFLVILLVVLNFNSIVNSITLSINYSKGWNRDFLQKWTDSNFPRNTRVRNDNVGMALNWDKPVDMVAWSHWAENSISEFQDDKDEFAILNIDWHQGFMFWFDTPVDELLHYPGIPYDKLKGSFFGLSFSEFKRYAVYEIYKPWQAPELNYIVIKIPKRPKDKGNIIKKYTFDNNLDGWKYYDFSFKRGKSDMEWNKVEGESKEGSLELSAKVANGQVSRFSSPFIPVKPGKTYTIEGFIKPDMIPEFQRDGFLRVDFFDSQGFLPKAQGSFTAVSGKVYGSNWQKKSITAEAPKEAKFLTVSFQRANIFPMFHYFIDDISVYETTEKPQESFKNIPYIKSTIPDNVVFPNSIY